ncbi:MAG: NUDIX hydrolase [Dehalococcoidia bacterium]
MDAIARYRQALRGYKPRPISVDGAAPAAVLVPLYRRDGQEHVILTKRTEQVEHHKGQVSFPGGAFDAEDGDLLTTALREAYEEIGVRAEDVEVIGQLDELVTISEFQVTPYVGVVARSPYPFVPNAQEVALILEVPVSHLLDDGNAFQERRWLRGRQVELTSYRFGEHVIWGATARILKQLLDLLAASR